MSKTLEFENTNLLQEIAKKDFENKILRQDIAKKDDAIDILALRLYEALEELSMYRKLNNVPTKLEALGGINAN